MIFQDQILWCQILSVSITEQDRGWWGLPVIPGLGRQRQENQEFKASLGLRSMSEKQANKTIEVLFELRCVWTKKINVSNLLLQISEKLLSQVYAQTLKLKEGILSITHNTRVEQLGHCREFDSHHPIKHCYEGDVWLKPLFSIRGVE